ncbi:MAG: hypothetical protein VX589_06975, partial [Myxococcota bacterium]|nr:hypothetical protein [Myxococcota bacterium]
ELGQVTKNTVKFIGFSQSRRDLSTRMQVLQPNSKTMVPGLKTSTTPEQAVQWHTLKHSD